MIGRFIFLFFSRLFSSAFITLRLNLCVSFIPNIFKSLFLVTASLICNSHTIQFTHVPCMIQPSLVYSQSCAGTTKDSSRILPSKRNAVPFTSCSQHSAPSNQESTFCPYEFACCGHFIKMGSYDLCPFVSGFFHST